MIKSTGIYGNSTKSCIALRLFREPLNVAVFFRISDKVEIGGYCGCIKPCSLYILKGIIYGMLRGVAICIEIECDIRTRHGGNGLQSIRINTRVRGFPHGKVNRSIAAAPRACPISKISRNRKTIPNIRAILGRNHLTGLTYGTQIITC